MKLMILNILGLPIVIFFSSFSFANWTYHYMKSESSPLSNAFYFKADGSICVTDFENQSDLLKQIKLESNILVTKCSNQDVQQINNVTNEYLYNDDYSFKATKVALPLIPPALASGPTIGSLKGIALGLVGSATIGCLTGLINRLVTTDEHKKSTIIAATGIAIGIQPTLFAGANAVTNWTQSASTAVRILSGSLVIVFVPAAFASAILSMAACSENDTDQEEETFE